MYNTHPRHLQHLFDAQAQADADHPKVSPESERRRPGLRNLLRRILVWLHWADPTKPTRRLPF